MVPRQFQKMRHRDGLPGVPSEHPSKESPIQSSRENSVGRNCIVPVNQCLRSSDDKFKKDSFRRLPLIHPFKRNKVLKDLVLAVLYTSF